MASDQRTGAYLSDLDHLQFWGFSKMTIQEFAQNGLSILSGLIVRTHIVGMALGVPFSQRALYSARNILL